MAATSQMIERRKRTGILVQVMRVVTIMDLLRDREWTTEELADQLDVSRRTVQRYIEAIQGEPLYAPLLKKNECRYRMMPKSDTT